MVNPAVSLPEEAAAEALLRDALAEADRARAAVPGALRRFLGAEPAALLNERTVAQVGATLDDLARQLAGEGGEREALAVALGSHALLLAHLHALAFEAQVADELAERLSLDPVIPPLMEALLASVEPEGARRLIAAQARFGQAQRRGELALTELPGDLLHAALIAMRACAGSDDPDRDARAAEHEREIRARFDEAHGRLGLLGRVVTRESLDLERAGVALFVTALALGAGLDRDAAVLSLSESQAPRLVLALIACGASPAAVRRNLLALHPGVAPLEAFAGISADRAAALLAAADY